MITRLIAGLVLGAAAGSLIGYFGKCASGSCPLTSTPLRGAMYGAALGLLIGFSFKPARQTETATAEDAVRAIPDREATAPANDGIFHVESAEAFRRQVLEAKIPCLVDFYSPSCPPCHRLAPVVERLAETYAGRAVVCKINVNEVPELARQYGIRSIPAVFFLKDGEVVEQLVGLRDEKDYARILDRLMTEG